MYHKLQSYDVWFLRYQEQRTEFFVILDNFLLIASAKSQSTRGASCQPVFMGSCSAISHMHLPCLPSGRVSPTCVLCSLVIGLMRNDGSVDVFLHGQYGFSYVGSCCYSRECLWNSRTKLCCMAKGK